MNHHPYGWPGLCSIAMGVVTGFLHNLTQSDLVAYAEIFSFTAGGIYYIVQTFFKKKKGDD